MEIKVVMVDDEPRAHKVLENYISRIPRLKLGATFLNATTAYEYLRTTATDLLLLDITMPGIDGFAFLRMLTKPPRVIFTTAHAEFALESYEYNAVDYLKKPISFERFGRAIRKLEDLMIDRSKEGKEEKYIDLKIDGVTKRIPFHQIYYFQSLGNYIKVITENKIYISQVTTKDIEDFLPTGLFVRIHKSYIVNKAFIDRITEYQVVLGSITLPIGKTYKKYVKILTSYFKD